MKFMQRAMDKQREAARSEAAELVADLEGGVLDDDGAGGASGGAGGDAMVDMYPRHVYRSVSGSEAVPPALPKHFDSARHFTCLWSRRDATRITDRVCQALGKMAAKYELRESDFKLKATLTDARGTVGFHVRVYAGAEAGVCVIDVSRRLGSIVRFHEVFQKLARELSDVTEVPASSAGGGDGGGGAAAAEEEATVPPRDA
uniref:NAF domain-containing protein n=1 Tax=Bicosoecida sp. CB-2014 TaxID=1486930 RepID=A0A7S1CKA6_9STRA|mmetsp:Transcript_28318/g.97835  ORF Transcript_28318/g.97835 Transcript_28318/m.97835 type:complete len:202 (+) Transcript_28318:1-606(+)